MPGEQHAEAPVSKKQKLEAPASGAAAAGAAADTAAHRTGVSSAHPSTAKQTNAPAGTGKATQQNRAGDQAEGRAKDASGGGGGGLAGLLGYDSDSDASSSGSEGEGPPGDGGVSSTAAGSAAAIGTGRLKQRDGMQNGKVSAASTEPGGSAGRGGTSEPSALPSAAALLGLASPKINRDKQPGGSFAPQGTGSSALGEDWNDKSLEAEEVDYGDSGASSD